MAQTKPVVYAPTPDTETSSPQPPPPAPTLVLSDVSPKPTIGRIVLYRFDDIRNPSVPSIQQFPAIVTAVNADGSVKLEVFGTHIADHRVAVAFEGLRLGEWSWPARVF